MSRSSFGFRHTHRCKAALRALGLLALVTVGLPSWSQLVPIPRPQQTQGQAGVALPAAVPIGEVLGALGAARAASPPNIPAAQPTAPSSTNVEVPGLRVSIVPTTPVIGYGESEVQVRVRLSNLASEPRRMRLETERLMQKNGDAYATGTFSPSADEDWTEVTVAPGDMLSVPLTIKGLTRVGPYEGRLRVRPITLSNAETIVPLQVVRRSSDLNLIFKGTEVSNNVLTMKPTSEKKKRFSFIIENPIAASQVALTAKVTAQLTGNEDGPTISITPNNPIVMLPGASKTVELTLHGIPSSGEFRGRLTFTDASGAARDLELMLQPSFVPPLDWLIIFILVLGGAFLSAIVGTAIPNLTTRKKLGIRFVDIQAAIASVPASEAVSKTALLRKQFRAAGDALGVTSFMPSAFDSLQELTKGADELEERSKLISEVAVRRKEVVSSGTVPSSSRVALNKALDDAATAIVNAPLVDARQKLVATLQQIESSQNPKAIRIALDDSIQSLSTLQNPPPPTADANMVALLSQLRLDRGALPTDASAHRLLELDYQAQCAVLYFRRYLGEIFPAYPGGHSDAMEILEMLGRGQAEFMSTVALFDSLQRGVTRHDVKSAIDNLSTQATVEITPQSPKYGEPVNFRLVFNKSAIENSPLLKEYPLRWSFNRASPDQNGAWASAYFGKTSGLKNEEQTVKWSVKSGSGAEQQQAGELIIGKGSRAGESGGKIAVTSFLVTLLGSVAVAMLSKATDMRPFDTFQDYINPFLWGFGLDRMKSLINSRGEGTKTA